MRGGRHDGRWNVEVNEDLISHIEEQAIGNWYSFLSGEENGTPLQYSCLENSTERSLAGYSPWSCRVRCNWSDLAQHSTSFFFFFFFGGEVRNFSLSSLVLVSKIMAWRGKRLRLLRPLRPTRGWESGSREDWGGCKPRRWRWREELGSG